MHRRSPRTGSGRAGYSMIETLVAMTVALVTASALAPGLLDYVEQGRASAAAAQLDRVGQAVQRYRIDVGHVPASLAQLVDRPGTGSASAHDIHGEPIGPAGRRGWRGPYLDVGEIGAEGLPVPGSGRLQAELAVGLWGGDRFLVFRVAGVDRESARRISAVVDGDTLVAASEARSGRVRWAGSGAGGELLYLADPLP